MSIKIKDFKIRRKKMKSYDLNKLPVLLEEGKITEEEATKIAAQFILENFKVFGLQKYDEDFRSEVIVCFLEKSDNLYRTYDSSSGDYFTYLYSFIKNIISGIKKREAKKRLSEDVVEIEIRRFYKDEMETVFTPVINIKETGIPYSARRVTAQDLREAICRQNLSKKDKLILSVIMKTAFYLNDSLIIKISNVLDIDINILSDIVDYYRNDLRAKIDKREKFINSRNQAYYFHRKYEKQICALENNLEIHELDPYKQQMQLERLKRLNNKQLNNWASLTKRFQNGFITIKPSNSSIAEMIGLCERQVSYYLFCIKKGKVNFDEIIKNYEDWDCDCID